MAATAAIALAVAVSFLAGFYLSSKKCDLVPRRVQRYLGVLCDSERSAYRIPQDKLDKLNSLITAAMKQGSVNAATLQKIAGKCMSMKVVVRPASLWTHFIFKGVRALDKRHKGQWITHLPLQKGSGIW